jgi:imidazole glycerol-phosphate synthase subunit HisF
MIAKRIIPLFLLRGKRLVKGSSFAGFVDVGDPVSQAMVYDAQGADEIIIVDVDASGKGRLIDTDIISSMIAECRLPIGAGGGIRKLDDARKCFKSGADKVIINTHAVLNPILVKEMAREFGSQSVVVSLDVLRTGDGGYEVYIYSGKKKVDVELTELVKRFVDYGAGEIMVTVIDREGSLSGLEIDLYKRLREIIPVPLIASGGAGSYDDLVSLFKDTDCDGCGIGKMLFLRDYDIVRIKSYLTGRSIFVRES